MHCVGLLEPAELSADLPGPLSSIAVDVVGLILENVSVVLTDIAVSLDGELIKDGELLLNSGKSDTVENIAHGFSLAILDCSSNCIGNVVHEICGFEISASEDLIHVVLVIRGKLSQDSLFDVVCYVLDHLGAVRTAARGSLVEIIIIHCVVLNHIDNP